MTRLGGVRFQLDCTPGQAHNPWWLLWSHPTLSILISGQLQNSQDSLFFCWIPWCSLFFFTGTRQSLNKKSPTKSSHSKKIPSPTYFSYQQSSSITSSLLRPPQKGPHSGIPFFFWGRMFGVPKLSSRKMDPRFWNTVRRDRRLDPPWCLCKT